ncbi:carbamoyltransferase HypF [Methanospirillum sp. J.3.6.1-F.2.7.3]|uniref:Carbamoyltransferase n=1 Tax=Methanospirillum purgamenti TaxID=2834276 RepID=A0A8E7EH72_9EURY|nr:MULTISPECIES: carbamoyltransferase HypF [Methanospirillum]MDX8549610.1 carbamoyltransferase HypF [Methanospirillum hungatei]QVV88993.1 carbamoyltransferase HypF [Methanospirillum sp. J.3.6.1-F.2.7.3]
MPKQGYIIIRGIVQGVGFRPFVYARAIAHSIHGSVWNTGSEVRINAWGNNFDDFIEDLKRGTPLSIIDSIEIHPLSGSPPDSFSILKSHDGIRTGLIPPDIATCPECVHDIFTQGGRYEGYFATSCVNCGPRYSIIKTLPYDRERTAMDIFPPCLECSDEYSDPSCRRHHAQTIACELCGPVLMLHTGDRQVINVSNPIQRTAELLEQGNIVAIRGIGGFHIACIGESSKELKNRLGRTEQPFAIMARKEWIKKETMISHEEEEMLQSEISPIVILDKKNSRAHDHISSLHTLGCMVPYTGLHHLLFSHLKAPYLIMTSANAPGYPMITTLNDAFVKLTGIVDYYLTHTRDIVNRCDDSVIRNGYIIRLSRGFAPKRTKIFLGEKAILGTGPELNSTVTLYTHGFCITSPHIGNVRNPGTYGYLKETIACLRDLMQPDISIIAHDLHPQFLSTRYAKELSEVTDAVLIPVQHHQAHIAATCQEECIGIAIDGVGYGSDGTIWGGEIFEGSAPEYNRVGHLMPVLMPGGDLATTWPERMLYGILPDEKTKELLLTRTWTEKDLLILEKQVSRRFNTAITTSTGRVLDAAAALLGICRKKTYDGEPAMKLESAAFGSSPDTWEIPLTRIGEAQVLDTQSLLKKARDLYLQNPFDTSAIKQIAASFQYNLARGIATIACNAGASAGINTIALSGGVAYNEMIRKTIGDVAQQNGYTLIVNHDMPLGDGCISFGQCVFAGKKDKL